MSEVTRSVDGVIRRFVIRYVNSNESTARFTDRSARKVVRLFSLEEGNWHQDMELVKERLNRQGIEVDLDKVPFEKDGAAQIGSQHGVRHLTLSSSSSPVELCDCCCKSHCNLVIHSPKSVMLCVSQAVNFEYMIEIDEKDDEKDEECHLDCALSAEDTFLAHITAINTDIGISTGNKLND